MIVLPAPGSSASRNRSGVRGQQLAVDGADLVRQRLHVAGGDGQHRVEQAGQGDALGLGDQLEVGGVGVEGAAAGLGDARACPGPCGTPPAGPRPPAVVL